MLEPHTQFSSPPWLAVVGLGMVGSWLVPILARTRVYAVSLHDFDSVTTENIGVQLYEEGDVGQYKADAIMRWQPLAQRCGVGLQSRVVRINRHSQRVACDIVIAAVDSWKSRHEVLAWAQACRAEWFLDARVLGWLSIVIAVNLTVPEAVKRYRKTLWTGREDEENARLRPSTAGVTDDDIAAQCGVPGTAAVGAYVASRLAGLVAGIARGVHTRDFYMDTYHLQASTPILLSG